jgi:hypothetical protein
MKVKIEIKSRFFGKVLFDFEKENNTVKDTLIEAVKQGADLRGAYLEGADLEGADLEGADLEGADLRGADLRGAYLEGIKIKKIMVFTGLYKYIVMSIIDENDIKYIKLGCHLRKVEDWENDFWNNTNEFPNNNSEKSNLRLFAYETAKKWFEIVK